MTKVKIIGIIDTGSGKANQIPEDMFQERCRAARIALIRGTLNVRVDNLSRAVSSLGNAHFETDKEDQRLGPLRWWRVMVTGEKLPLQGVRAFVVRHYKTGTTYLEVMSSVHFCDKFGLRNGDRINIYLSKERNSP